MDAELRGRKGEIRLNKLISDRLHRPHRNVGNILVHCMFALYQSKTSTQFQKKL